MRYLSLICLTLFFSALQANAGEVVELRGDLVLSKCVEQNDGVKACSIPFTDGIPVEIELSTPSGSTVASGKYKFKNQSDGFTFEGTIDVSKISHNGHSRYLFQTWVTSMRGQDPNTLTGDYSGSVTVENVNDLNEISFHSKEVSHGKVTLGPKIFIGPKDANFSGLLEATSQELEMNFQ